jgi:prepilin-type N-terminal cleavage/methylation domain-containing protein
MKRHIFLERSFQGLIGRMKAKNKDGHWQRGFTLVEVLVAIILIVIIGAIAIPSYLGYSLNTNLKAAARNIQADFLELKERAIAESTAYRITFDQSGNTYTIEKGTETGAPYTPIEVKTLSAFGGDVGIFNAVFGGGIPTITFEGRGITTTGKVVLTNSRGSTATIAASVSGRTYVQVNNQ